MLGVTAAASALVINNRRHQAERAAAVQWRNLGPMPVVVTSQRLLARHDGRWLSWPHRAVRQVDADPATMRLTLAFEGAPLTALDGPFVPWMSVLLIRLLYGDILEVPPPHRLPPAP